MTNFTPWSALLGGALIGAAASLLLWFNGRVAGISGIVGGLLPSRAAAASDDDAKERGPRASWFGPLDEARWRGFFVAGLLIAGFALLVTRPSSFGAASVPLPWLALAGLLVGFGTRLGGGCTSGHGVCGLSRLSARSLVATATFMLTAAATTFVVRHVLMLGGGAR